jgi:hypothetical protein
VGEATAAALGAAALCPGEIPAVVPVEAAEYLWKYSAYRLSEYAGTVGADVLETPEVEVPQATFPAGAKALLGVVALIAGVVAGLDAVGIHPFAGAVAAPAIPAAVAAGGVAPYPAPTEAATGAVPLAAIANRCK